MKIQRLLSIVTYLLNREIVSASELAVKYAVSVRTIQRDIDTICAAGIPIVSAPGAKGGYGIVEGYRLDRQMIDSDDMISMITSLENFSSLGMKKSTNAEGLQDLSSTLEKVKSLANTYQKNKLTGLKERLFIDFSSLSIDRSGENNFYAIEQAVNEQKVISFTYGSPQGGYSDREVEPMTIAFKWFSWYLYGFCLKRQDYRLFRISRISNLVSTGRIFARRTQSFLEYQDKTENQEFSGEHLEIIVLRFQPAVKVLVKDYFQNHTITENSDGTLTVECKMPNNNWVIGMILSYGTMVEVISPVKMKNAVIEALRATLLLYK